MHVHIFPRTFLERFRPLTHLAKRCYASPILETVQLACDGDGKAWISATDGAASVRVSVPILRWMMTGKAQLPGKPFVKHLAESKGPTVEIEASLPKESSNDPRQQVASVSLRTPRSVVKLPSYHPENFPELSQRELSGEVQLPAWRLVRLIERTEYAVDEDSASFALGGCVFEFEGEWLHAVATNGHSIAQALEPASGTAIIPPPKTVVGGEERPLSPAVPRYALKILASLLATMENSSVTVGYTSAGTFEARGGDLLFSCRVLEGRFPEWKWVFPTELGTRSMRVIDPQSFLRALKEAYRYTVQGERATRLTLRRSCLTITVKTETASSEVSIPVQNLSPERDLTSWVVIDPGLLLPMLPTLRAACVVSFPPDTHRPLVFESEGFRFAVMPMEGDSLVSQATDSTSVDSGVEQSTSDSGAPTDGEEAAPPLQAERPRRRKRRVVEGSSGTGDSHP